MKPRNSVPAGGAGTPQLQPTAPVSVYRCACESLARSCLRSCSFVLCVSCTCAHLFLLVLLPALCNQASMTSANITEQCGDSGCVTAAGHGNMQPYTPDFLRYMLQRNDPGMGTPCHTPTNKPSPALEAETYRFICAVLCCHAPRITYAVGVYVFFLCVCVCGSVICSSAVLITHCPAPSGML